MAQVTDRTVGANPTGFDMRTELNNIIGALESDNSGASEPLNPVAYMKWLDTSNATYYYYKERNHDNTAWVTLFRYTVATKIMEAVSNGVVLSQTDIANEIHASSSKTTPVDADEIGLIDSASTFTLKNLTWANLKATLKNYFDTLYVALTGDQSISGVKTFTSSPIVSGIKVGNTAIADATTLDWYEEGTFTPTIVGGTTAGVGTYTSQVGSYTRFGDLVEFSLVVSITAHTGTGALRVSGLPFSAKTATNGYQGLTIGFFNNLVFSGTPTAYINSGQSFISFIQNTTNAPITNISIDTSCEICISGTYRV